MYYQYFGLKEAPFSIAPNPHYLLMTERHQEALAHLYHGIQSDAGFVLLTGDIGTGKTTVCRRFLSNLPDNTDVAFILNPCLDGLELLHAICKELSITGIAPNASLRQLTDAIYEHLLASHAKGVNTVLLIDEAQQLYQHVLELIRLLTNLETDTQKLLKIILVGQPELNDLLKKPDIKQLSQRITARYHIKPLTIKELSAYIEFRLRTAGYDKDKKIFPLAIVKKIFAMSEGIPRLVNVICDRALLGAYAKNAAVVNNAILEKAFLEVKGNYHPEEPPRQRGGWGAILVSILCLCVLATTSIWANRYFQWQLPLLSQLETQAGYIWATIRTGKSDVDATHNQPVLAPHVDKPVAFDAAEETANHKNTNSAEAVTSDESNQPPAVTITELTPTKEIPAQAIRYTTQTAAMSALIERTVPSFLSSSSGQSIPVCSDLSSLGWQCNDAVVVSWSQFKKYNRPAIITLQDADGDDYYFAVMGVDNTHAQVIADKGVESIPLIRLGEDWLGEFQYLWQPPTGFSRFIYRDSRPALINWLAKAFATIDGRDELLARNQYNDLLRQRIMLYQRKNNLKEDGKAGIETLLKLNEDTGVAVTLTASSDG